MKSVRIRAIVLLVLLVMMAGAGTVGAKKEQSARAEKVAAEGEDPQQPNSPTGVFCIPTTGAISQRFHSWHTGIDIASGESAGRTPVYAAYTGRIVYRGTMNIGYSLDVAVAINHGMIGDKYVLSHYHHMGHGSTSYVEVNVGDWVEQGDLIGYQGDYPEPETSGVHLHFAVAEMDRPFLDQYTHWGDGHCQRTDLWYELGGGGECGVNPDAAIAVNPESETYLGSLQSPVAETCFQSSQSPPTKASDLHPTGSGWYNHYTSDNTPSFAWTAATDPDGDLAGYYIAIDDPTPDGEYGNDWTIGKVINWTVPSNSPISEGSHFVAITSHDSVGHVNPPNTNKKGDAPYYDFVVDTRPPTAPTISINGSGCGGIQNNMWQNTCYNPAFTWSASDSGSGVKDYHRYWGTSSNDSPNTWTPDASFAPGAIAAVDGYAIYYLNLTARDNLLHESGQSSFGVLYDGTTPTIILYINNDAATTNQTTVRLNLSAADTGSNIADVRVSDNGLTWSDWQPYADTIPWSLPALDRRTHTIYVQVRDKAGNESTIASDSIYLDLYPPMSHSDNYRICADVVDVGGSVGITSTNYSLVSAIGQPWGAGATANTSSAFSERAGFLSSITGCLPITDPIASGITVTQWVVASGGNLRGSTSYRLGDTAGQPAASETNAFTSTSYVLSSGFWAQVTGTVPPAPTPPPPVITLTPTPTPTPSPTPTPQPGGFGVSINDGNLYTNDPLVTVRAWAPNVTHVRLSNDGGYADEGWMTYQVTVTWVLSTYGDYVLPRYVYAWFLDANNSVYSSYFDDIIYDPVAPQGQISLLPTDVATATLWLEAWDDNSGVTEMKVSEDLALSGAAWQPFTNTLGWVLTNAVIYAQFSDNAGNESCIYGSDGSAFCDYPYSIYLPVVVRQSP